MTFVRDSCYLFGIFLRTFQWRQSRICRTYIHIDRLCCGGCQKQLVKTSPPLNHSPPPPPTNASTKPNAIHRLDALVIWHFFCLFCSTPKQPNNIILQILVSFTLYLFHLPKTPLEWRYPPWSPPPPPTTTTNIIFFLYQYCGTFHCCYRILTVLLLRSIVKFRPYHVLWDSCHERIIHVVGIVGASSKPSPSVPVLLRIIHSIVVVS